jgi:electron transport complex protein RnfG
MPDPRADHAAQGKPIATVALVGVIAAGAALVVTASWEFSRDRIAANERVKLLENLSSVLEPSLIGRDLNPVSILVEDPELLGSIEPVEVFLPIDGDRPLAAIFASVAPDGYNAPIRLLIGISVASGQVTGVRAVSHRETPGLGDRIEIAKSNWIRQFDGTSANDPAAAAWAVTKEDGAFDSITGATVTARAVIRAVHDTLLYFDTHRDELIAAARAEAASRSAEIAP